MYKFPMLDNVPATRECSRPNYVWNISSAFLYSFSASSYLPSSWNKPPLNDKNAATIQWSDPNCYSLIIIALSYKERAFS